MEMYKIIFPKDIPHNDGDCVFKQDGSTSWALSVSVLMLVLYIQQESALVGIHQSYGFCLRKTRSRRDETGASNELTLAGLWTLRYPADSWGTAGASWGQSSPSFDIGFISNYWFWVILLISLLDRQYMFTYQSNTRKYSLWGLWILSSHGFGPNNVSRYEFYLVKQALNPI